DFMRSTIMFRALITLAAAAPSVISAQAVEVTPFLGAFLPVSELLVEDEFSGRHSTGFAGGLRLAYQTGSALGFAASTTYAVSDFGVEDEGERLTGSGHVMAVSGTARYRFPAGTSRV